MSEQNQEAGSLNSVGRSTALLTVAASIGQIFGIGRELFVAGQVGTSANLDALLVALVLPTMLTGFLASGASTALVPAYTEAERTDGLKAARRLAGVILTWSTIFGLALVAFLLVFRIPAIHLSGPGLDPAATLVAAAYLPVLAPILLFAALSGLMSAIFQVEERFVPIAIAWTVGPIASFIVTIAGWPLLGLGAFALALTINAFATLLVLIVLAIRAGIMPMPALRAPSGQIRDFGRHMIPLTISASVLQFNLLTDRAIASLLVTGAVSALRFAENIVKLPLNTLGPAWSKAIYPALVLRASGFGDSSLGDASHRSLRYVIAIFVPLSVATAALAPILVDVAYRRGAFGDEAAFLTSGTLAGFAPLIVLTMAQSVLVGAHNARRRGWLLMTMGFANAIMNLVFNILFARTIGVAGVALSSSVTLGIVLFAMAWRLDQLEPDFRGRELAGVTLRATVASAMAALPVAAVAWGFGPTSEPARGVLLLVALTLLGAGLYTLFAIILGLREPREVVTASLAMLRRRTRSAP